MQRVPPASLVPRDRDFDGALLLRSVFAARRACVLPPFSALPQLSRLPEEIATGDACLGSVKRLLPPRSPHPAFRYQEALELGPSRLPGGRDVVPPLPAQFARARVF